jgi:N utilization substance protein B
MTSTVPATKSKMHPPKKPKIRTRRRRSRELVLQGIYQWRVAGGTFAFIEDQLKESTEFPKTDKKFFSNLLQGVLKEAEALEKQIQPYLDRPLDKLNPVECAILLISTYELTYYLDIPYRAIINEAIELARSFGGTDGHRYVNGVLDKLAVQLRAVEIEAHIQSKR